MLSATPYSAHPPWNSSTLPSLTSLEQAEHSDDLHYAHVHSSHLVQLAQQRIRLIRSGQDPDADPRAIQPRWNVSSKMEEEERKRMEEEWRAKGRGMEPGEGYEGLMEREKLWEELKRREREEREVMAAKVDEQRRLWKEWERKEQWNAAPEPIIAHTTPLQRPPSEEPSPEHSAANLARHNATLPSPPVPSSSAVSHPLLTSTLSTPYCVYSHPGHYGWVSEGRREWSCCHSVVETVRGCVLVGEKKDKRRLLPANGERGIEGRGRVVRYEHGGVWEAGKDGVCMWSCCSMEEREGRGCVARTVVREQRWNLE